MLFKKILLYTFFNLIFCNISLAKCKDGNCKNGFGTFVGFYDSSYVGQFKDGKFHGEGIYTWSDKANIKGNL